MKKKIKLCDTSPDTSVVKSPLEALGPILLILAHFSRSPQSTRDVLMKLDLKSDVIGLKLFLPEDALKLTKIWATSPK